MNVIELKVLEDTLIEFLPKRVVWILMPLIRQKTIFIKDKKGVN